MGLAFKGLILLLNSDRAILTWCFSMDERVQKFSTKWQKNKKKNKTTGLDAKQSPPDF